MPVTLRIRDFLKKSEVFHFARIETGTLEKSHLHDHDFSEIFWVEEGTGVHWIQGKRRPLRPGSLIFVRPGDIHTLGTVDEQERMVICNLAFSTRLWLDVRKRHLSKYPDWFRSGSAEHREREVSASTLDFLRQAGLEMNLAPRSGLMLERFFLNLAVALSKAQPAHPTTAPAWLAEALRQAEGKGLFREGPAALARLAGRSQEHVAREAKQWLKKTPTELINDMRMRHAARCLSATQNEILDICLDCGLENVGHFYALFRRHYRMTPRRYRLTSQSIVKPGR